MGVTNYLLTGMFLQVSPTQPNDFKGFEAICVQTLPNLLKKQQLKCDQNLPIRYTVEYQQWKKKHEKESLSIPIGSMYGIFTYIYHKNQPFM